MPSWTEPDDVTDAWIGADAPTDETLIQTWIDKAEREIKYRITDIQDRIDAEAELDPAKTDLLELAVDVTVAMVTRVFRNPEGLRQTTVTTGPFSESRTVGGNTPGLLALTDEEMKKLSGRRGGAFEINLDTRST